MSFDPDAYLKRKQSSGFDPDAYLANRQPKVEEPKPSKLESAIEGAKEGASFGFLDELGAAMEGAGQAYLGIKGLGAPDLSEIEFLPEGADPKYADVYKKMLERRRATQQTAREANPISYGAGAIGGGLATSGPGLAAGKAIGGLKGLVGVGAAEGALAGAGSATEGERLQGAGIGAGIGAGASLIGPALSQGKKLLPATTGSVVNKPAAKVASLIGGGKASDIEDFLSNPELRRKMRATDVDANIADLTPKLGKQIDIAQEAVGKRYNELQDLATPQVSAPTDIADPFKALIQDNKGLYSNAAKGHVNSVDKILKGKMSVTKNMNEGQRVLFARRYLDNRVRDIKATPEDRQLYDVLRKQLSEPLKEISEMVEADKMYSQFKDLRKGVERPILDKSTKEISPEKLSRVMRSQTLKGTDFMKNLGNFDQFVATNPKLNQIPEVKTAVDSLADLKKTIEMGQLQRTLETSGGPTSQAVNTLGQGIMALSTGGQSLLALPFTNPVAWSRIVDMANQAGQTQFVKSIEKAAPALRSAMVRGGISSTEN